MNICLEYCGMTHCYVMQRNFPSQLKYDRCCIIMYTVSNSFDSFCKAEKPTGAWLSNFGADKSHSRVCQIYVRKYRRKVVWYKTFKFSSNQGDRLNVVYRQCIKQQRNIITSVHFHCLYRFAFQQQNGVRRTCMELSFHCTQLSELPLTRSVCSEHSGNVSFTCLTHAFQTWFHTRCRSEYANSHCADNGFVPIVSR